LLVGRVQVGAAVEQPGTQSELVSFYVRADAAGREAQLLVRILPEEGSYACWTLRKRDDPRYSSFLNTFDAFKA
jgi:hypothetical protein